MFTKALAAAALLALSACAPALAHNGVDHAADRQRTDEFARLDQAERQYGFVLGNVEKAVDERRLALTDVQELQYYLSRAEVGIEKAREAYDAQDRATFERSLGQVELNTERMRAIVFPRTVALGEPAVKLERHYHDPR